MRVDELNISHARQNKKRKGRGISGGQGKTAGRGTKGQRSRSGGKLRPGFEGGQNPLIQRIPKLPGFKSRRTPQLTVRLSDLEKVKGQTITNQALFNQGLIKSAYQSAKVVATGELKSAKTVKLQSASVQAVKLIEKAGGKFTRVPQARSSDKSSNGEND